MYTTVSYDNLDTYLAGLAANTQDTPYEIEISNVTVSFLYGYSVASQGTLQYALQNNATKYVSLKFEAPAELDSIGFMCYGCKSLVGIVVTGMENVTVAWNAFGGCNSLTSVDVSCMESLRRAHGMFNGCTSLASVDISAMMELTEVHNMFAHCSSLESITLPTMAGVTDAHNMFQGCTFLTSVDVSGMTSVTDASYMFQGCTSLSSVDASGMTSLTNVYWMFKGCTSLTSVDVSGMTSLTDAHEMFQGCTSLTSVDVSGMTSVTNANWMFNGCSSLTSVDVSGMTSVTDVAHMFSGCTSFVTIDVSGMTSVTNAYKMFDGCDSLTSADVSGMTSVTDVSYMFRFCTSLTSVDVSDMASVTNAYGMFYGCRRLVEIHGWSIPPTAEMTTCFDGCTALEAIYVPEPSPSESSWRAWDIRKDTANNQSTVTVYNPDGTSNSVSVPSAGTYTMKVTDKVDELLFSPSEEIPAATIQKMLQTKAPITAKDALDPTKDNFMLWAKDRASARTNVTTDVIEEGNKLPPTSEAVRAAIGSVVPVDIVEHGNMSAVTSNAVSISLSYSTEETLTGGTWIDGKPIYKRTFEVYKNGILNGWTRNGVSFTCSAGLSYIDQLIKNEAITDRCILTSYGFGTDNVQYPVGIYRNGTNTFEIRNGNATNFFGTKCILTIEYTRKTE